MEASEVASPTAIADVGETLVSLLEAGISSDSIVSLAPPSAFNPNKSGLSVFLFDVAEQTHLANDREPVSTDGVRKGDPLVLELSYLLTAHPSAADEDRGSGSTRKDYHQELGKAMRILHDNSIISGSQLKGTLGDGDRLHVSLASESRQDILDIWGTFQETPYLPSVAYLVTPVIIDSDREHVDEPVEEATFHAGQGIE